MKRTQILVLLLGLVITACAPVMTTTTSEIDTEQISAPPAVALPSVRESAPQISPYSLEALAEREYGLGELTVEYPWHNEAEFTRYYITYDSDNLTIHGYVNIPKGKGPFPVVIALHGYIPPSEYQTLAYSPRYADAIAQNGYIVLP